jgi:hypothetical protein
MKLWVLSDLGNVLNGMPVCSCVLFDVCGLTWLINLGGNFVNLAIPMVINNKLMGSGIIVEILSEYCNIFAEELGHFFEWYVFRLGEDEPRHDGPEARYDDENKVKFPADCGESLWAKSVGKGYVWSAQMYSRLLRLANTPGP